MSLADEMKDLVLDIADSRANRQQALCDIRNLVAIARHEADEAMKTIKKTRIENAGIMREKMVKDKADMTEEVQRFLKEIETDRKESSAQLMKDLREDVGAFLESARSIRREISARIREGLEEAGRDRRAKTSEMLASCQEHRSQAASALRQELAGGRAARLEEAGQLKEEFAEGTALRRAEIVRLQEETINFLTDSHALLKASLAEAKAERLLGLQEMRDEVNRLRKEFADEREVLRVYIRDAAAAWQGPRAAEETRVSGDSVPAEIAAPIFPEEVRPEKISAEARQEEPVRVGAAEEKEPVDEVSSWGGEDIRTKILAVVGANPGGVTLTEVAEKLGMATVALGRTSRDLSDEGKIRREGKHYFPVPD